MSVRKLIGVLLFSWHLAACASSAPSHDGFAEASAVAGEVETERLMPTVAELYHGHLNDPKIDCTGYAPATLFPACDLSHDSAIALVVERFQSYGYAPEIRPMPGAPLIAYNVIAERRGVSRPNEVVLVGAHLDAFFGGADDNSSAVAIMLEIARVLSTHATQRTLRFVGFDLEEYGLIGSERYVASGAAADVALAVIFETVGYASEERGSQTPVPGMPLGTNGDVGDFIAAVGNADSADTVQRLTSLNHEYDFVRLKSLLAGGDGAYPITGQLMRSDHGPFWVRNMPALMLTDSANYRNSNYHQSSDTPDTLNPDFLGGVARLGAAIVALAVGVVP